MPELPEVETVVRALREPLLGRTFGKIQLHAPSLTQDSPRPPRNLTGQQIEKLERRGKYILATTSGGLLAIHLRMTGWLGIRTATELERERKENRFVRATFELLPPNGPGPTYLVFRDIRKFGRLWWGTQSEMAAHPALKRLGPDALGLPVEQFLARMQGRHGRLKSLLLDQSFLAGLGNIYADETLFLARLNPLDSADRLGRKALLRLHAAIQRILNRAIEAGGTTVDDFRHPDGRKGWFQQALKVYGREDRPCTACKRMIRRIVVGQRGTWFCPSCQRPKKRTAPVGCERAAPVN